MINCSSVLSSLLLGSGPEFLPPPATWLQKSPEPVSELLLKASMMSTMLVPKLWLGAFLSGSGPAAVGLVPPSCWC